MATDTPPPVPQAIVRAALAAARDAALPVAEVPLETIAGRAGISRATLFRRIGSKRALLEAVAAAGVDPGGRPGVRERAISSAAHLIAEAGVHAMTMELLAERADCAVGTLYATFGTRDGVLQAVFEAYSPLPAIMGNLPAAPATVEEAASAAIRAVLEAVLTPPRILPALVSEALARPHGPLFRYIAEQYLPAARGRLGAYLAGTGEPLALEPDSPAFAAALMGPPAVLAIAAALAAPPGTTPSGDALEATASALGRALARGLRAS